MSVFTLLTSQGHAEDVLLWYRYNYYVLGVPMVSDAEYDELERYINEMWPINVIQDGPGSDRAEDYPAWIREDRRPVEWERKERDSKIERRWMEKL